MAKFRKKPVIIEAIQWNGLNTNEILDFCKDAFFEFYDEAWKVGKAPVVATLFIKTLEGTMIAKPNDYIIRGVHGEFYPCKPDIFKQTYELVVDE